MQRHRLNIPLTIFAALFVLWVTGFNQGKDLQPTALSLLDDIAAWREAVFVVKGQTLLKLNARLEVVKSVTLPLNPTPAPPDPIPDRFAPPQTDEIGFSQQLPSGGSISRGKLCADQQKVYVLYKDVIFVYDHDLNFLLSEAHDHGG